jgi:hypothetical protein
MSERDGRTLGQALRIFDAGNAAALASELFRESFNADFPVPREECGLPIPTPPSAWRQYVALYTWPDGTEETVGFCNFIKHGEVYLEGGMCVRKSFYRRLPREHFRECKAQGGLAQMMMKAAEAELTDCVAWFGYCGDAMALAVDLRAGYEPTSHPYLIAKWFGDVPPDAREALVQSIARIGPF